MPPDGAEHSLEVARDHVWPDQHETLRERDLSLSQEADRLTFRLEGMSAVRGDGTTVPVSLHIAEIRGKEMKRDRLLASGELPPGQYLGISFRVTDRVDIK